jgi:hypothetical protein
MADTIVKVSQAPLTVWPPGLPTTPPITGTNDGTVLNDDNNATYVTFRQEVFGSVNDSGQVFLSTPADPDLVCTAVRVKIVYSCPTQTNFLAWGLQYDGDVDHEFNNWWSVGSFFAVPAGGTPLTFDLTILPDDESLSFGGVFEDGGYDAAVVGASITGHGLTPPFTGDHPAAYLSFQQAGTKGGLRFHEFQVLLTFSPRPAEPVDVLMQGELLTQAAAASSPTFALRAAEPAAPSSIAIDFEDGVLGEIVAYRTGPNDLGDGLTSVNNRQGRYVAGKGSSTGLGNHPPFGGGASWQRLGLYDATSVEGWEIPTNDSTTTVDFKFATIPDPGSEFRLIDASSILEIQYHSADMDDQQDLSIGIMFGFLGDGIPQEIRFYIEGYGDGLEYFEVHTNNTQPGEWYVAKHTIAGSEATFTITDSNGAIVLTHTRTLPASWVQVLWLEAYASRLHDTSIGPTQWLEVSVDNLEVTWASVTFGLVDVLMQAEQLTQTSEPSAGLFSVRALTASTGAGEIQLTGTVQVTDTNAYPYWIAHDPVVVGDPDGAWSDGDDATYAEVVTAGSNGASSGLGRTGAHSTASCYMVSPAPGIPAGAQIESLTFRIRARHVAGSESPHNQGLYCVLYKMPEALIVADAGATGQFQPSTWTFPDEFTTQELTVQAYDIEGMTELGWAAAGFASQEELDAYVDERKTVLADTLRSGGIYLMILGGGFPPEVDPFHRQGTQYDVAEATLEYAYTFTAPISVLMQAEQLTQTLGASS